MKVEVEVKRTEGTKRYFVAKTVVNEKEFVMTGKTQTEAIKNLKAEIDENS